MMTFGSNSTRFDVQRSQRLAHHNGPTSRAGSEAPHFGVGIPTNAISHDRLSAIVGGSGLTDSCVRERKTNPSEMKIRIAPKARLVAIGLHSCHFAWNYLLEEFWFDR